MPIVLHAVYGNFVILTFFQIILYKKLAFFTLSENGTKALPRYKVLICDI